jgi:sarcosine oxidase subunit beta
MNKRVIIIGAGISGMSIAYHLAKKGVQEIHVIDKGYFTSGATGRCGAGVRSQWATPINCLLAKKSIEFFEKANEILAYDGDVEFKQEGYLILATTLEEDQQFKENVLILGYATIRNEYEAICEILGNNFLVFFDDATAFKSIKKEIRRLYLK